MPITEHEVLTISEAAEFLRVSRSTLLRMISEGTVPVTHIRNSPRVLRSDLESLFAPRNEGLLYTEINNRGVK